MITIKFLIILLILVTVHELGHFLVAKLFNVYVSEFALGFGPKIFSYQGKETKFSIRALPLGGYAAMVGEDGVIDEDHAQVPFERTVKGVNRFKQFLIMFAGSFMNLLLAFVIFCGIAANQDTYSSKPIIGAVEKNSPAYVAGLRADDYVKEIRSDGNVTKVATYTDLQLFSSLNKDGKDYQLVVVKNNKEKVLDISPKYNKEEDRYLAGFSPKIVKADTSPIAVLTNGFNLTVDNTKNIFTSLKMLVTGKVGADNLSGPVGMVKMTEDIQNSAGIMGLVNFMALLSVNLAVFNLLPIPALDGGRILIIIIESITRKRLNEKFEERIIGGSFMLLMALIIFVTFNDITKLFK